MWPAGWEKGRLRFGRTEMKIVLPRGASGECCGVAVPLELEEEVEVEVGVVAEEALLSGPSGYPRHSLPEALHLTQVGLPSSHLPCSQQMCCSHGEVRHT
jgi:hypothetical protein